MASTRNKEETEYTSSWRDLQLESSMSKFVGTAKVWRRAKGSFVKKLQLAEKCSRTHPCDIHFNIQKLTDSIKKATNLDEQNLIWWNKEKEFYEDRLNDPHRWWIKMHALHDEEAAYIETEIANLKKSLAYVNGKRSEMDTLMLEFDAFRQFAI